MFPRNGAFILGTALAALILVWIVARSESRDPTRGDWTSTVKRNEVVADPTQYRSGSMTGGKSPQVPSTEAPSDRSPVPSHPSPATLALYSLPQMPSLRPSEAVKERVLFLMLGTRKSPHRIEAALQTWLWGYRGLRVYIEPGPTDCNNVQPYVCTVGNYSKVSMGAKVLEVMKDILVDEKGVRHAELYEWVMMIDDDTYVILDNLYMQLNAFGNPDTAEVYRGKTVNIRAYRDPCLNLPLEQRKAFTPVIGGPGILFSRGAIRKLRTFFRTDMRKVREQAQFGHGDLSIGFWSNCAGMRGQEAKGFLIGKAPLFDGFKHEKERQKFSAVTWHYSTAVPAGELVPRMRTLHECVAEFVKKAREERRSAMSVPEFAICALKVQGEKNLRIL